MGILNFLRFGKREREGKIDDVRRQDGRIDEAREHRGKEQENRAQ